MNILTAQIENLMMGGMGSTTVTFCLSQNNFCWGGVGFA